MHAQYFDFSLPQADVREDTPFWVGPAVFNMLRNEKLLDAVESIIGPEIYSNPVQHVRLKPPEHLTPKDAEGRVQLGKTPVHQDNGVVLPEADQTEMLTVWFPLWDATVENGCLVVWPQQPSPGFARPLPQPMAACASRQAAQRQGEIDADATWGRAVHAQTDGPRLAFQPQRQYSLELRPALQPDWPADRPRHFPRLHRPQPQEPETELRDPAEWARRWHEARHTLATEDMGRSIAGARIARCAHDK